MFIDLIMKLLEAYAIAGLSLIIGFWLYVGSVIVLTWMFPNS